jgi:tetratricopeptide (TPR) repeat protein
MSPQSIKRCGNRLGRRFLPVGFIAVLGMLAGGALPLRADDASDAVAKGNLAYRNNRYEEAILDYSEALRLNPNDALTYGTRGMAYAKKGFFTQAIEDFSNFIRLNPEFVDGYLYRGSAYEAERNHDQAIADYNTALRLNPDNAQAFAALAVTYEAKGDHPKAIANCRRALQHNPNYVPFFYNRGNVDRRNGDYERAIADYSDAVQIRPDLAVAYNGLAWVLATAPQDNLRNGSKALEYAQKAYGLTQGKIAATFETLAAAAAETGDFTAAVTWETKYLGTSLPPARAEAGKQRLGLYQRNLPYREAAKVN